MPGSPPVPPASRSPLLLAIRLAARRPRRALLGSLSIAVTVSGIVAVLFAHATLAVSGSGAGGNPGLADTGFVSQAARENQVLLTITVMLVVLAMVNVTFITWATVQDARHAGRRHPCPRRHRRAGHGRPVARAARPGRVVGALAGLTGGYGLFTAANQGGGASQPPAWWLITALLGTLIAVAGLTGRAGPPRRACPYRGSAPGDRVRSSRLRILP